MAGSVKGYLEQLLQIHWLRPETALWRTFDCLLMEKYGEISGTSADFGCGDGTMSFVMAGGVIPNYDVFMDVGQLEQYDSGADIYNCKNGMPLEIAQGGLRCSYDWGIDHKEGLIDKHGGLPPFTMPRSPSRRGISTALFPTSCIGFRT